MADSLFNLVAAQLSGARDLRQALADSRKEAQDFADALTAAQSGPGKKFFADLVKQLRDTRDGAQKLNAELAKIEKSARWDALVAQQGRFRASLIAASEGAGRLQGALSVVGGVAAATFASATIAIAGFGSAASPALMAEYTGWWHVLSAEIGVVFAPAIAQATLWVRDLAHWFRGLSETQQSWVVRLGLGALALGALGVIVPRVIGVFSALAAAIRGVVAALTFLYAHPVLAGLAALAASIALVVYLLGRKNAAEAEGPVSRAAREGENMAQVAERLQAGGRARGTDLEALPDSVRQEFARLASDPARQRAYLEQRRALTQAAVERNERQLRELDVGAPDYARQHRERSQVLTRTRQDLALYDALIRNPNVDRGVAGGAGRGPLDHLSINPAGAAMLDIEQVRKQAYIASLNATKNERTQELLQAQLRALEAIRNSPGIRGEGPPPVGD